MADLPIRTVHVDLGDRSYDIDIAAGILQELPLRLSQRVDASHVVIIADANVAAYAQVIAECLAAQGRRVSQLEVPAGERSKSVAAAARLWDELYRARTDRRSLVVAVGGGVVGDLAGYVAASYARGLRFCQVPTTILAQVDSSVGGKVGINLSHAKNMVGAFWQPVYVLIDTDVLQTLPDREYISGLAEVVKYGVIMDADFFERLEREVSQLAAREPRVVAEVVARCCRLKADVVEQDERETSGRRAILNYGHTFAHALEAETDYGQWLHGEAVSIGMVCAARLAVLLGRIDCSLEDRQRDLLQALHLPVAVPKDLDNRRLMESMQHDKKVEHGRLRFVLPTRLGHVELVNDVPVAQVQQALSECR